jgi:hypothetical protein
MAYFVNPRQLTKMWRWLLVFALSVGLTTFLAFALPNKFWPQETPMYVALNALIAFLWGFLPGFYLAFMAAMFRDWLSRADDEFPGGHDQKWRRPFGQPPRWYYRDVILTGMFGPREDM